MDGTSGSSLSNFSVKSIWNFDDEQFRAMFSLKQLCIEYLSANDLENLYWVLRSLRSEIIPKLTADQKKKVNEKLEDLVKTRETFHSKRDVESSNEFYIKSEEFYILLCELMVEHGIYFREGDDPRKAALKR